MRKNVDFISSSITTSSSNSDLTSTKKMSKQLKTAVTCSCFLAIVSSKLYFVNLYIILRVVLILKLQKNKIIYVLNQ